MYSHLMKTIIRQECCMCGSKYFLPFLKVPTFPIFMGTTTQNHEKDLFHDQVWVVCRECGCLQLKELIPLDLLYSAQHSSGAIGAIWENHHKEFCEFILQDSTDSICEIGAGHSDLARKIINKYSGINYLVIEPNPQNVPIGVKVIPGFMEDNLDELHKYDTLVHSHVLEHVYQPRKFIQEIGLIMRHNTSMYVSFPNIEQLINSRGTNSLNFEHTYYLHPFQFRALLKFYDLTVVRERKYLNHSYFFKIVRATAESKLEALPNISKYSESFKEMWVELKEFVQKVNAFGNLDSIPTYLFGAHVFSQALLSLGLESKNVVGILDNANAKNGERLYGTKYNVYNPKVIQNMREVRVILKTSHYQNEIKSQLFGLNSNVEIIE